MPKTSIIIPTHNRPELLPRAVESAQRAGCDVEVVVVDDASIDQTASVCRSLKDIKYVRVDRNQGVAGARNIGLLASSGDYIGFLDDDDLRLPGSIAHQLALLEAAPEAGFVAGGILLDNQDCGPITEVALPRALSGDIFWKVIELGVHLLPASVLVRKSCFLEVGIFNQHIPGIDDWDMWCRIAEQRPVIIDDRPVCIYRRAQPQSGQGSSKEASHLHAAIRHQQQLLMLDRARAASPGKRRLVRKNTRRRVADTLSWHAAEQIPNGELRFAGENFLTALRISPLWAARPTHVRVFWRAAMARLKRPTHVSG